MLELRGEGEKGRESGVFRVSSFVYIMDMVVGWCRLAC